MEVFVGGQGGPYPVKCSEEGENREGVCKGIINHLVPGERGYTSERKVWGGR